MSVASIIALVIQGVQQVKRCNKPIALTNTITSEKEDYASRENSQAERSKESQQAERGIGKYHKENWFPLDKQNGRYLESVI